ncbi:hypothetical protein GCM10010836_52190 [Aminobacter aminovorans]
MARQDRSGQIGPGKVVALVEQSGTERDGAGIGKTVAEIEVGRMADRLAVAHAGSDGERTDIA